MKYWPLGLYSCPAERTPSPPYSPTYQLPVSGAYEVHLHGPNGFFRKLAGDTRTDDERLGRGDAPRRGGEHRHELVELRRTDPRRLVTRDCRLR